MTFTDIVFTLMDAGMKYGLRITRHNAVFCQQGCWCKSAGLGRPAVFCLLNQKQTHWGQELVLPQSDKSNLNASSGIALENSTYL